MATNTEYQGDDKVLIGFILGVLTFWLFANSMMNVGQQMAKDLAMDANTMNIAVSLAALFSGIFVMVAGGLADSIGRVKILRIGLYLSIAGSLLVAITPTGSALATPVLLLGRVLQGLSAACVMPTSLGLLKVFWQGKARQRAISLWSMGTFGGSGFTSLFGGLVASSMGWRAIFYISVVVAVVALALIKDLPESKKAGQGKFRFDYVGVVIFMIAMLALEIFITKGNKFGWGSTTTLSLAATALVFGGVFYWWERRSQIAFVDFRLFKNSVFTGAMIANFLINATAGLIIVALMLMQKGAQYSPAQAGMLTLGFAIAVIVFMRFGEKLLHLYGARKPIIWAALIIGVSVILMMQTYLMTAQYKILAIIAFTLFGIGLAFFATPATDAALSNLPDDQSGSGAGIFKMASSLGSGFGVAISAGIYTAVSKGAPLEWLSQMFEFVGRQDNLAVRQAAMLALAFNLLLVLATVVTVMIKIPKDNSHQA